MTTINVNCTMEDTTVSNVFTPVMQDLLKSYKQLTHTELQEIAWLMSLKVSSDSELFQSPKNITCKTEPGFQAAIELFAGNSKIDFITYEEKKNRGREGTYNYSIFQYRREEEGKYQIVIKNHWSYHDSGRYIEEFDHDYYSLSTWRERVLKIQSLTASYLPG